MVNHMHESTDLEIRKMLLTLPDEVLVQILDYLSPEELLPLQQVCQRLSKVARDSFLWRAKCFEKAPSATYALTNTDTLTDMLNGLTINTRMEPVSTRAGHDGPRMSKRAQAIFRWDCTDASEDIDWYSEFIARQAPLTTEWHQHLEGNEIRSMALFDDENRILSAMEDGSVAIYDINTSTSGRRSIFRRMTSGKGLLYMDLTTSVGPSSNQKPPPSGIAIDSTVVHESTGRAYIATRDILHEVDLSTMSVVSQNKYGWNITAISQQLGGNDPLMVGTAFSLHMHDPRIPLRHLTDKSDAKLENTDDEAKTVFLPNYNKKWRRSQSPVRSRINLDACAKLDPGPQTIVGIGLHEISVAGRMPSILFYDKRKFPQLQSVIHSGARLSSLSVLPHPPPATSRTCASDATLIAAGEYHGRGSLELYELPHVRSFDAPASYGDDDSPVIQEQKEAVDKHTDNNNSSEPYSFKNRQSSSASKLLSVATQGARIVYSDGDGKIHWVERDGRGLARRWNINDYIYSQQNGVLIGDSVARKILTFEADSHVNGRVRGDGDILFWTGSDIGMITSKLKWSGHDELVKAFEEQMSLEDSPEGAARRREVERKQQEETYARVMRQALERQADERRFLARFGRMR